MDNQTLSTEPKQSSKSNDNASREDFLKMFHPYGNIFQAIPSEPIVLTQYGIE